jgi:hypothetical protein
LNEGTIGCLFSSKDEVTGQQVFNFRSIVRQLGRRSTPLRPRWQFTSSERIRQSELIAQALFHANFQNRQGKLCCPYNVEHLEKRYGIKYEGYLLGQRFAYKE